MNQMAYKPIEKIDKTILSTEYFLKGNGYEHDKKAVALALSQGKENIRKAVEEGLISEEEAEEIYLDNGFSWMDAYENAGLIPEDGTSIMERKWNDKKRMNNYGGLFNPESDRPIEYGDSTLLFDAMESIDWEEKRIRLSDGEGNTFEGRFALTKEDEPEPGYFEKDTLGKKIFAGAAGFLLFGVGISALAPMSGNNVTPTKDIGEKIMPKNYSSGDLETITVDDEPGDADYSSIQEGVDAADPGDIIKVFGGDYREPVRLDKDSLKLKGVEDVKDNEPIPIISTGIVNSTTGIKISKGKCAVEGFKLDKNYFGIKIMEDKNKIHNNKIVHNDAGVGIDSQGNVISGNLIEDSTFGAIVMKPGNVLKGNDIVDNYEGVDLYAPLNKVTNNNFIDNEEQADFYYSLLSHPWRSNWNRNYWDDWDSRAPRPIHGMVGFGGIPFFPLTNYDLVPRQEPVE